MGKVDKVLNHVIIFLLKVRQFVEMGFNDEQARQALRSANNNPRLATNFLLSGMQ